MWISVGKLKFSVDNFEEAVADENPALYAHVLCLYPKNK